jgi:prenylcysteine oxidase / farnesylcysteine lyase
MMQKLTVLLTFFLQVLCIRADELQSPLDASQYSAVRPHRVAIIGAGPGGSATSYYLRKFSQSADGTDKVPIDISLFDSNSYIGGRTTTVNALDDPRYPVELGASIFVEVNHILYNTSREFGLLPAGHIYRSSQESKYELGVWDGQQFVFTAANDDNRGHGVWQGWWDIAKLLWKYGLAPIRTRQATSKAVGAFLKFYSEPIFPFWSINEAVQATGLEQYTGKTGTEVLKDAWVGEPFSREIIQASTRVNYASNLGSIHGLETFVCMAIEGAMAIDGGNWQIFDNMVAVSADRLLLNTTVTAVARTPSGRLSLTTDHHEVDEQLVDGFDTVILAAPYQFANISFTPPILNPPKPICYVELYVTLFTSPHRLSPDYFGVDSEADVPSSVLTTLTPDASEQLGDQRGVDGVGLPGFWSISTLDVINPSTDGAFCGPSDNCTKPTDADDTQYVYKIFSPAPLTGTFLSEVLGFEHTPSDTKDAVSALPKADIPWHFEKHWYSYPYEAPRTEFEKMQLCQSVKCDVGGVPEGMWYLNGMESFISTMETSALSGMNIAKLVVDSLRTA